MKKIIFALLLTPLLSFSSLATDTPPTNTSGTDNTPNSGSGSCQSVPTLCEKHL